LTFAIYCGTHTGNHTLTLSWMSGRKIMEWRIGASKPRRERALEPKPRVDPAFASAHNLSAGPGVGRGQLRHHSANFVLNLESTIRYLVPSSASVLPAGNRRYRSKYDH
jgi:hypothetical protein